MNDRHDKLEPLNPTSSQQGQPPSDPEYDKISARALRFLPLYVLVPVAYALILQACGYSWDAKAFGLGALGWIVALLLRGPVSAAAMKLPKERGQQLVVGSSGVLEEGVRLALLALTATGTSWAFSVGQGWAAVEVLFVMINVVAIASLVKRTDEKAVQAKQMLEAQGNVQAHPLWGILERIWASAFHIGCTLIVAKFAWAVVLLIPAHSGLNLTVVGWMRGKKLPAVSAFVGAVGATALLIGILVQ